MTYGEAKVMVLVILDEHTTHGELINEKFPELRMSAEMFEAMGPTPEERAKAKRREFWLEIMKIAAGLLLYWAMALAALVVLVFLFN